MIKTITKVGNSKGIILDAALLEMAHLKEGDRLSVTVHETGTLTFTPLDRETIDDETFDQATDEVLTAFKSTLKKLS